MGRILAIGDLPNESAHMTRNGRSLIFGSGFELVA